MRTRPDATRPRPRPKILAPRPRWPRGLNIPGEIRKYQDMTAGARVSVRDGSPKSTTDTLQRVLNAAARLVTNTDKYDRGLSSLLHDQLHWLNVSERIEYKLAVMIRRCLGDKAPTYLSDYCIPVTAVSSRHLRSVNQHQLAVPRCRRITFGHRTFSVAGPMVWNSLPTEFRDLFVGFGVFRRTVKTILFARYWCIQRNRGVSMILRCQ